MLIEHMSLYRERVERMLPSMLTRRVLVLSWPSQSATLVSVPLVGPARVLKTSNGSPPVAIAGAAETNLGSPGAGETSNDGGPSMDRELSTSGASSTAGELSTDSVDEVRVSVDAGVIFRIVTVEGGRASALVESARYAAEPTLPLPLADLAVVAVPMGRRQRRRSVLVAAIPLTSRATILAWGRKLAGPRRGVTWIGPSLAALPAPSSGGVTGAGWAALASDGVWTRVATGRNTLTAREAIDPPNVPVSWTSTTPAAEAIAVASARADLSWPTAANESTAITVSRPRRWPLVLAVVALIGVVGALGLRYAAAQSRITVADAAIEAAFVAALPGARPVAPLEQIRRRFIELQRQHEVLADRVARRGSALAVWMLLDQAAPSIGLKIDDLKITSISVQIMGSADNAEMVQTLSKQLNAPHPSGAANTIIFREPETRRSSAGLGIDFTLQGEPPVVSPASGGRP